MGYSALSVAPTRERERVHPSVELGTGRGVTVNDRLAVTGKGTSFAMKYKPGSSVFLAALCCGTFKIQSLNKT